jgi:hypothetical protein
MDLVTSRWKLLECIMVGVNHRWTRGHPTGEIIRDDSQSSFDHLAHTHNKIIDIVNPFHEFHVPPDSQAELLNEGGLIHYEISRCVTEAIHTAPIHTKILRDTNWTHHQFALIDWEVHGQAFKVLARFRHMSICKLIYQLLPTNTLQAQYYGVDSTCPCCEKEEETFLHILSCPSCLASTQREMALEILHTSLARTGTSTEHLRLIEHGLLSLVRKRLDPHYKAKSPTSASVRPVDMLSTACYVEQTKLGWDHLRVVAYQSYGQTVSPLEPREGIPSTTLVSYISGVSLAVLLYIGTRQSIGKTP